MKCIEMEQFSSLLSLVSDNTVVFAKLVQGLKEEWFTKPPVDLVPTVTVAGWPLLYLPTA